MFISRDALGGHQTALAIGALEHRSGAHGVDMDVEHTGPNMPQCVPYNHWELGGSASQGGCPDGQGSRPILWHSPISSHPLTIGGPLIVWLTDRWVHMYETSWIYFNQFIQFQLCAICNMGCSIYGELYIANSNIIINGVASHYNNSLYWQCDRPHM